MLEVLTLAVGDLAANCHMVSSGRGSECIVVDCGGEAARVAELICERELEPVMLVSTHAHADHIAGNAELLQGFNGLVLAGHPAEADWYGRPSLNLSYFLGRSVKSPRPDRDVVEGDTCELAGAEIKVLHLPGHSPGSIGLLFDVSGGKGLIGGDVLFAGGIGRTDLHGGDSAQLARTINDKVLKLPDSTVVYTGHGPETTVGEEKRNNPFIVKI